MKWYSDADVSFVVGLACGGLLGIGSFVVPFTLTGNTPADLPVPYSTDRYDRTPFASKRTAEPETDPDPVPVKAGEQFKVGTYTVLKGWRVYGAAHGYGYGGKIYMTTLKGKLRNDRPGSVEGVDFHLKFIRADGTEASSIWCLGGAMSAGETLPLGCNSNRNDWPAKYDRIELVVD